MAKKVFMVKVGKLWVQSTRVGASLANATVTTDWHDAEIFYSQKIAETLAEDLGGTCIHLKEIES